MITFAVYLRLFILVVVIAVGTHSFGVTTTTTTRTSLRNNARTTRKTTTEPQRYYHFDVTRRLVKASLSSSSSSSSSSTTTSISTNNSDNNDDDAQSSSLSTRTNTRTLTLFSPCKINLFLRILGERREDGFHNLASLFQAVGFGDTLTLTLTKKLTNPDVVVDAAHDDNDSDEESSSTQRQQHKKDVLECNMPGVPVDDSNLVLRALQLLRDKTSKATTNNNVDDVDDDNYYFHARLEKQVPAQAGLGGGSANAATALWGANQLLGQPATLDQLVEWSAELGSDITFFLSRGTAYCTGRGEIMTPIDPPLPAGTPVCLVKPKHVGLSTPSVFGALDYDGLSNQNPEELLEKFVASSSTTSTTTDDVGGVESVPDSYFVNDLEPPAFTCLPMLADLRDELQQVPGFHHVLMSGSGSTIFCIGQPDDRREFEQNFGRRDDLLVYFSEFINREDDQWFERPSSTTTGI